MSDQMSNAPRMPDSPTSFVQTWINALIKPSEQTFVEIAASPNAKSTTAYLWVFISALVQFFIVSLVQSTLVRSMLEQQGLGNNLPSGGIGFTLITAVCGAPILAVISVVLFAVIVALVQWIAKMFGGHGTYDQLAYTFAAIGAPFGIVSAVFTLFGAIPYVGFCFRIVIGLAGLYVLVLEIMAVKGVNPFGWGAAAGPVLNPISALFLVCCCLVFAASTALGAAIGDIFNGIYQSLAP